VDKHSKFHQQVDEIYRGQTVYQRTVQPSNSRTVSFPFHPKSPPAIAIESLEGEGLLGHQKEVFELVTERKNALIMLPTGSGKSTSTILITLKKTLEEGKNVLFIYPSQKAAQAHSEILKKTLRNMHFDWVLDVTLFPDEKIEHTPLDLPRVLVTDVKSLHSLVLKRHKEIKNIFLDLDLIIIEELHLFRGIFGSNCSLLFRRLKRIAAVYESQPVFLLTSKPIQNYFEFIQKLCGIEVEADAVINKDSMGLHSQDVIFWVPPIDKVKKVYSKAEEKRYELERTDYFNEIFKLVVCGVSAGLNTVVVSQPFPLCDHDVNLFGQNIEEILRREGKSKSGKYFFGNDLCIIRSKLIQNALDWSEIDLIIYAGFNGPISEVKNDIMHIGRKLKTYIYIIFPQMPAYQFYVNHPEELFERGVNVDYSIERVSREPNLSIELSQEALIAKHLKHLLLEHPLQRDELVKFFQKSIVDYFDNHFDGISKKKDFFWFINKEGKARKESIELFMIERQEDWTGLVSGDDLYVSDPDNAYSIISEEEAGKLFLKLSDTIFCYEEYFPGAICIIDDRRYRVLSWKGQKIHLKPGVEFGIVFKEQELKPRFSIYERKVMCKGSVQFGLENASIQGVVKGYRSFKNYDIENPEYVKYKSDTKLPKEALCYFGLRLHFKNISIEVIHTLSHLLLSALKTVYSIEPDELGLYFDKSSLFLYDKLNENKDVLFFLNDEQVLLDLFNRAFQILIDCPCESGCPGCIQLFECVSEKYNGNLNKLDTLEFLGKLLKKEKVAGRHVKYKSVGIENNQKLGAIVKKSIFILDKKCKANISSPYDHKFFDEAERKYYGEGLAGLCSSKDRKVYILKGLKEASCFEVVSHEFFHNWQMEGNLNKIFNYYNLAQIDDIKNIPYRGLLFAEGSSTWAAYKAIDYFGLRELMYTTEMRHYSEYREGFILMKFLEEKFGLVETLNILKKGSLKGNIDLNRLYHDSGIYDMIIDKGRTNYRNKGELICLGPEYLSKTTDLVRLTHYITRPIPSIGSNLAINSIKNILEKFGSCGEKILKEEFIKAISSVLGRTPAEIKLPCISCKSWDKETLLDASVLIKGKDVCDTIVKRLAFECK